MIESRLKAKLAFPYSNIRHLSSSWRSDHEWKRIPSLKIVEKHYGKIPRCLIALATRVTPFI